MTVSTADLSDAHPDKVRVLHLPWRSFGGNPAFGGPVVTIKCFEDNSLVKALAATPGEGRVMVVDGGGSLRRALLGDMIAENAVSNGWTGLVIFGAVRDCVALGKLSLGVKALGTVPVKTEKKGIGEQDVTLELAGVTVNTGDYIYADSDGVLVASTRLE